MADIVIHFNDHWWYEIKINKYKNETNDHINFGDLNVWNLIYGILIMYIYIYIYICVCVCVKSNDNSNLCSVKKKFKKTKRKKNDLN